MLEVLKWIFWVGGGIVMGAGAVCLNIVVVLCGVLIFGFGSLLALLLRLEDNVDELNMKMDFIIEKKGWKESFAEYGDLSPEQLAILNQKKKERAEKEQKERELLESVRQKHPDEDLTPEQLGKLLDAEKRAREKKE